MIKIGDAIACFVIFFYKQTVVIDIDYIVEVNVTHDCELSLNDDVKSLVTLDNVILSVKCGNDRVEIVNLELVRVGGVIW